MDPVHLGVAAVPEGNSENRGIWLAPGSGRSGGNPHGEATLMFVTTEEQGRDSNVHITPS